MTTFDTFLETPDGNIPAVSGPDGTKIPGAVIARNGLPVSATNPLDTTALATLDSAQLSSFIGAIEAGTAALVDAIDLDTRLTAAEAAIADLIAYNETNP